MSGVAVDRLDLEGGLTQLSGQVSRVKGQKTSKLNLLDRAIDRFEEDPSSVVVWRDVQTCKEKADDCCEAFTMLLETIIEALGNELAASREGGEENPLQARMETVQHELDTFEVDRRRLYDKFFRLAGGIQAVEDSIVVADVKVDVGKVKPADTIKPNCASLKLTPSEFQVWLVKAKDWIQQSNFLAAEVNVQHLYVNSILDKETQQKVEALAEYEASDAFEVLVLVERVHDTANPFFVKRSNFFAAHRSSDEKGSAYIARIKVLGDLAKLSRMDEQELIKFKVLMDLPLKVREKVLRKPDMDLEALTKLVDELEAMELIHASLRTEPGKTPKIVKAKEEAMQVAEKEKKKKEADKDKRVKRKLPEEAYQMGCWVCGGQHRHDNCKVDKSGMICEMCGKEQNHVIAVCLKQFDSTAILVALADTGATASLITRESASRISLCQGG